MVLTRSARSASLARRRPASTIRGLVEQCVLALGSAGLLLAAFPNFTQWWLAWCALVPWLVLLRRCRGWMAFAWSYGIGLVFFLASTSWLTHVTVGGWLLLGAYLALFFAAFGWVASHVVGLATVDGAADHGVTASADASLVIVPAAWVAFEFLRSHAFSGFGWNLLAYSQTPWRDILQIAEVTGAWGLSFLIVLVNVGLANLITRGIRMGTRIRHAIVVATCLLLAVWYGTVRIPQLQDGARVRVAVVQGNIPQAQKWDATYQRAIQERYSRLTDIAADSEPDLIVWPETSVPGTLDREPELEDWLLGISRRVRRPLVVGVPLTAPPASSGEFTNSALFVHGAGTSVARYDKLHLVPFGEFVPFARWFPWLRQVLPPIGDFVPGGESTVFTLTGSQGNPLAFGVLICFEDIFPGIARRFVQNGAQLLLNITNDAWFGPTAAAYQHAQATTLRAVELRVPIARAANTGWSGCIDATGAWVGRVSRSTDGKELFVMGTQTCDLILPATQSLYRRWGDWFAGLCLLATVLWVLLQRVAKSYSVASHDDTQKFQNSF